MSDIESAEYSQDMEIEAFLAKYGAIRILQHLAGCFDFPLPDGVIRRPAELENIRSLLQAIEHRISCSAAPSAARIVGRR